MLIDLLKLTPSQFEDLIHDLYQKDGFDVVFHAGEGPDGGRDLIISKTIDDSVKSTTKTYVVQCKRHKTTVNKEHVKAIRDTVDSFKANGYILAVTSKVSEPLLDEMRRLDQSGKVTCRALLPREIHERIVKHRDVFARYFPGECDRFDSLTTAIRKEDLREMVNKHLGVQLSETQLQHVGKLAALFDVKKLNKLNDLLQDGALRGLIDSSFNKILRRKPSSHEVVIYSMLLSNHDPSSREAVVYSELTNLPEYVSKLKFMINFNHLPIATVAFNEVRQEAFGFRTYHSAYKGGKLEVLHPNNPAYQRAVKIESQGDAEFRVVYLGNMLIPSRNLLAVDYNSTGFFQFFVLVTDANGKKHFAQYIDGEGTNCVDKDEGIDYMQIYSQGLPNGTFFFRKELNFFDDLKRILDIEPVSFHGLFIGVKGSLTLYNILLY